MLYSTAGDIVILKATSLTSAGLIKTIEYSMRYFVKYVGAWVLAGLLSGCGLLYQGASGYRAQRMEQQVTPGESMREVHDRFGEPDIRACPDQTTEIWSYAKSSNNGDITAKLLYTASREGDAGTFVDVKFIDGKVVSVNEANHTMPTKLGSGFSAGLGGPSVGHPGGIGPTSHY